MQRDAIDEFLDGYPPGSRARREMETIVEVVRAIELEPSIENGCALVDIFAHGEVDLVDGRVIGAPDEMGFYLTEFFELLMAAMPAVGLNVANWRVAYFRQGRGHRDPAIS